MSYIQVTNQFVNTTPLLATACNQNFSDLTSGMSSGLNDFNVAGFAANGSSVVSGGAYTVPLFDFFASANVSGWDGSQGGSILCEKIGKTVFIQYIIEGQSTGTTAYFNLPYTCNAASVFPVVICPSINYTSYTSYGIGNAYFPSVNTVAFSLNSGVSGIWPPIADKIVFGTLFYESV
jgi:hypothetical protein